MQMAYENVTPTIAQDVFNFRLLHLTRGAIERKPSSSEYGTDWLTFKYTHFYADLMNL